MLDQVLAQRGQSPWGSAKLSVAGDGLLERMRSTAFALLGISAAMGLGLVAIIAQQDWSDAPGDSIPALYEGHRGIGDAEVVARPSAEQAGPAEQSASPRTAVAVREVAPASQPGGHDQPAAPVTAGSPAPSPPGASETVPQATPEQAPTEPQPAPAPAPTATAAPAPAPVAKPGDAASPPPAASSTATSRGHGNAYAKGRPSTPAETPIAEPVSPPAEQVAGPAAGDHGHAYGRAEK